MASKMIVSLVLSVLVIYKFPVVEAARHLLPGGPKIRSSSTGPISGDCWQGALCRERCLIHSTNAGYVGEINRTPVCCPFCEKSGLAISPKECNCRHNGPDPRYVPTKEELQEVEDFKRQLNIVPKFGADYLLMSSLLLLLVFGK